MRETHGRNGRGPGPLLHKFPRTAAMFVKIGNVPA
jgi:hypothetical protein